MERNTMTAPIVVAALYKFVTLEDYDELREPLLNAMVANGIKGTLLIAEEGINGKLDLSEEGFKKMAKDGISYTAGLGFTADMWGIVSGNGRMSARGSSPNKTACRAFTWWIRAVPTCRVRTKCSPTASTLGGSSSTRPT